MKDVFAERIQAHIDEEKVIYEGLLHEGPAIIRRLQDRGSFGNKVSLRSLAIAASLSPTYLSKVVTKAQAMSKRAYLRLVEIEAQWIEHEQKGVSKNATA